jgi:hypothetical protein
MKSATRNDLVIVPLGDETRAAILEGWRRRRGELFPTRKLKPSGSATASVVLR